MKRRMVLSIVLFLLLAAAGVWLWRSRPEPRQPDVYYDFSARLPEARIEDEGFLGLWKFFQETLLIAKGLNPLFQDWWRVGKMHLLNPVKGTKKNAVEGI